ncbi:MAG: TonB-dependent receptor [Alphaproteobacteria bacterium]|nr:TonB-dependent receptor [Alphaproteobacteria bacterium]
MSLLSAWLLPAALAATLEGQVRERGTGDPLGGALVESGELTVKADGRGRFTLELPEGEHLVTAYAADHEPASLTVELPTDRPVQLFLLPAAPGIEIVVESERELPHVSGQVLDRERIEKLPGTYGDPIRLLQALPGVAATPEYSPSAGDVAVRGAFPSESRFFLDGVEIPYLFHFQQYSSVYHTRLVDEIAFYPSSFGAPYGDATGAIAWTTSRKPDTERVHGGVSLNTIMAGGYVTAPAGPGVFSASARRSFADLYERGSDQYTVWPIFWDYLGRYDQDIGDGQHHVAVTLFGAGDRYGRYVGDTALLDPLEQEANAELEYDRAFHSFSVRLEDKLPSAELRTALAFVRDDWKADLASESSSQRLEHYAFLRHDALLTPGPKLNLATGLELKASWVQRQTDAATLRPELAAEAPMLALGVPVDERVQGVVVGTWLEPRLFLGPLRVQPGLRAQFDTGSRSFGLDPRLTTRWQATEALALKGGAGRYTQAPSLDALSAVTGDPTLRAGHSDQAALGAELTIAERLELGAEGWGKRLDQVVVEPSDGPAFAADGYAVGLELLARYRMRERFFSWASITLGRAVRDGAPFAYDQPLSVNLVTSWDFRPGWNAGVRYRYASGLPYTPVEGALYVGDTDSYTPVYGDSNSARLANYQKLDVHVERSLALRRWTLVVFAEMGWVPKSSNEMYIIYSYDYSEQAAVGGPGLLPLVGGRIDL